MCIGFTPNGLLPYIFDTAFFKWAWFTFSGIVLTMLAVAIFNTPMLKFVIYALSASVFMVHRTTPPVFCDKKFPIKKGLDFSTKPCKWVIVPLFTSEQVVPKLPYIVAVVFI